MKWDIGKNSIACMDDEGGIAGQIDFREISPGLYDIFHTEVNDSHRGKGLAAELVKAAVDETKWRKGTVQASCSYAKKWMDSHPNLI